MGLTAWAQEQQAKHEAWREIDELRRQNAALVAELEIWKARAIKAESGWDQLSAQIPKIQAEYGRAGFVAGRLYGLIPEHQKVMREIIEVSATIYTERVKDGQA